jgi:hypothetical protein
MRTSNNKATRALLRLAVVTAATIAATCPKVTPGNPCGINSQPAAWPICVAIDSSWQVQASQKCAGSGDSLICVQLPHTIYATYTGYTSYSDGSCGPDLSTTYTPPGGGKNGEQQNYGICNTATDSGTGCTEGSGSGSGS